MAGYFPFFHIQYYYIYNIIYTVLPYAGNKGKCKIATRVKLKNDKHDPTNEFLSSNIELKIEMDDLLNNSMNAGQKSAFIERLDDKNHMVLGET